MTLLGPKTSEDNMNLILYALFILVAEKSISYTLGHNTLKDVPVNGKYGYITFTILGGLTVNFDLINEKYEFHILLSTSVMISILVVFTSIQ